VDTAVVHPIIHPFDEMGTQGVDRLDEAHHLTCENGTPANLLEMPVHALKVATRVRALLGLLEAEAIGPTVSDLHLAGRLLFAKPRQAPGTAVR
jgi:hypothetical protein